MRPLVTLKPPTNLPVDLRQALQANLDSLICSIDFAPTLAHLFGAELAEGLRYPGYNLFEPVPRDRIAYVLITNEWRGWAKSAAAIFRGRSSATVDYLDEQLCRTQDEAGDGPAYSRDELLGLGFAEPLVQKAMAQIYKNKLHRR